MPILAQAVSGAAAPAAPAAQGPASMLPTLLFFGVIVAIVYFLMIRPQKKKESQRKEMLNKLDRGDQVVTIGGVFGEVESVNVKEEYVILLVDRERGTTLKYRRGAIHEILPKDSGSADIKKL
jgi:preprotein translocase subunit YajC